MTDMQIAAAALALSIISAIVNVLTIRTQAKARRLMQRTESR